MDSAFPGSQSLSDIGKAAACFYEHSFIGMQLHLFMYYCLWLLSCYKESCIVETETISPVKPKILTNISHFLEKNCQPLVYYNVIGVNSNVTGKSLKEM